MRESLRSQIVCHAEVVGSNRRARERICRTAARLGAPSKWQLAGGVAIPCGAQLSMGACQQSMIAIDRAPRLLLRIEGVALATAALLVYFQLDYSVVVLIALLAAVDLSLLGFLAGPRVGTLAYNLAHTTSFPLLLGSIGVITEDSIMVQISLAWLAHIGVDRALGLGFKYPSAFKDTHLQRV
jgi:Domain of unknown function (DUF4260)